MEFDKTVLVEEPVGRIQPPKNAKVDGNEAAVEARTNGARVYGVLLVVFGLGTLGVCFPLFQDYKKYTSIRDPLNELGSDFAYELGLPLWLLGTACGFLVAAALAFFSYANNKRLLTYVAMALALAAAALQIYACVTIKVTLEGLLIKLEGNPVSDATFTAGEKSIMDFTAAVFNKCCLVPYDSRNYTFEGNIGQLVRQVSGGGTQNVDDNQRPVKICEATLEASCPTVASGAEARMFPEIVDVLADIITNLYELLCHCISSTSFYDKALEIIERDDLCEAYRGIVVPDADSRAVPTTTLTFETLVLALNTFRPEYAGQLPIGKFAFVGKILPPDTVYNEPAEEIGWSCGLGYAKADAYYMYLFIEDTTNVLIIGGLVFASFAAIVTSLLFIFWLSGGGGTEEEVIEYENYDDILNTNKKGQNENNALEHYNI